MAAAEVLLHIRSSKGPVELRVEVAATERQQARGLQGRRTLSENVGMLFVYPHERPPEAGFWMFRTRIPLDIAFLDEQGGIVSIKHMQPCSSAWSWACPRYAPGVAYWTALEVNAGFLESQGIVPGDEVRLADGRPPGALAGGRE